MKATSVTVSLDTRRARKDGSYPLILRLTHDTKTTSMRTGIYLKEADWDSDAKAVKKSCSSVVNVKRLNNEIQKKKAQALDGILKLQEKEKRAVLSVSDVKHRIEPSSQFVSFYGYGEKLVKELIRSERIGTARSYAGVINVLKTFNKGRPLGKNGGGNPNTSSNKIRFKKLKGSSLTDLSFQEITYSFLMKLETYHLAAGNERNGLAVYMRTIRSIYNQAIKSGLVDKALYPFDDYKIKTEPTKKRALDIDDLQRIINLELPHDHPCFNARNYFVASYMMNGMNFADMAHLKKSALVKGRINYRRRKTGKLYDIKIAEGLQKIFSYYIEQHPASLYVFPILKRETGVMQEKDIQWARKRFNIKLKAIADLCEIKQDLTSYVSRHSFATQAILHKVPLNAISAMLGHSSVKTTELYLKGLPAKTLDEYSAMILGGNN